MWEEQISEMILGINLCVALDLHRDGSFPEGCSSGTLQKNQHGKLQTANRNLWEECLQTAMRQCLHYVLEREN